MEAKAKVVHNKHMVRDIWIKSFGLKTGNNIFTPMYILVLADTVNTKCLSVIIMVGAYKLVSMPIICFSE